MPPLWTVPHIPAELLHNILSHLDSPSYIQQRLHDDPAETLDDSGTYIGPGRRLDLKNASRVCSSWRAAALPLLLRHVQLVLRDFNTRRGLDRRALVGFLDFLDRYREGGPLHHAESLTVVFPSGDVVQEEDISDVEDDYGGWGSDEDERPPIEDRIIGGWIREWNAAPPDWNNNWLWSDLFDRIDALRVTFIGPPVSVAALLGRKVDDSSVWAFATPYHILSLSRTVRTGRQNGVVLTNWGSDTKLMPCNLFGLHDWTDLLFNEGSSLKIYSKYDFFNHVPPSLLVPILNSEDPSMFHLLNRTLRSLSYVAVFPLSQFTTSLISACPPIERLYVQIVPRNLDQLDGSVRGQLDASDLWMERNTAYSFLMASVFDPGRTTNPSRLRVFETGDAADAEAWEQAVQYVEAMGVEEWRVAGHGRFVRDLPET